MHPGTLRDVPRYSQSVTPPTHSPGPRPQLQLYVPQCGYHLDGPYSNTVSARDSDRLPTRVMHDLMFFVVLRDIHFLDQTPWPTHHTMHKSH